VRPLSQCESLALVAALDETPKALHAWSELLVLEPWGQLSLPTQRCLPRISKNLSYYPSTPEIARLRGVYRATWAANVLLLREVFPVLKQLGRAGIDFRPIKGAAICVAFGHWGLRRMGDIDVVCESQEWPTVLDLLKEINWNPLYFETLSVNRAPRAVSWVGQSMAAIDIHFSDWQNSSRSFQPEDLAFLSDAGIKSSQGNEWRVPEDAALAAISISHAEGDYSSGDRVQTLLDLALLLDRGSCRNLCKFARLIGHGDTFDELLSDLVTLGLQTSENCNVFNPAGRGDKSRALPTTRRYLKFKQRISKALRAITDRKPSDSDFTIAKSHENVRPIIYPLWLRFGQLGAIERVLHRVGLGLMSTLTPQSGASNFPIRRDRRYRVELGKPLRGKRVRVVIVSSDLAPRLLLINGRNYGTFHHRFEVVMGECPSYLEISARWHGEPPTADFFNAKTDLDVWVKEEKRPDESRA
jgi:hypothetical protein